MGTWIDPDGRAHDAETGQFVGKSHVNFGQSQQVGYGTRDFTPKEKGGVYMTESEDALIELRRDQDLQYQREAAQQRNESEKAMDQYKQKIAKPRRKGMEDVYKPGHIVVVQGHDYEIVSSVVIEEKFAGYTVYDAKNRSELLFLSKYGDIRSQFPRRYRDL